MSYLTNNFDEKVVELLKAGGVGFIPTDTIYGLSARALDESAVEKIYKLKKRDQDKPFIVLISDSSQLLQLGIEPSEVEPAKPYWPGSLTLVCQAPAAPAWLHRGGKTLAVRLPDREDLRHLIKAVGPIVSTSANKKVEPVANSVDQAQQIFGQQLDFYVDGGDLANRQPSTVARANDGKLVVLRPGTVNIKSR